MFKHTRSQTNTLHKHTHTFKYMYVCMCVCVYVCVYVCVWQAIIVYLCTVSIVASRRFFSSHETSSLTETPKYFRLRRTLVDVRTSLKMDSSGSTTTPTRRGCRSHRGCLAPMRRAGEA